MLIPSMSSSTLTRVYNLYDYVVFSAGRQLVTIGLSTGMKPATHHTDQSLVKTNMLRISPSFLIFK